MDRQKGITRRRPWPVRMLEAWSSRLRKSFPALVRRGPVCQNLGRCGEKIALKYLKKQGYRLLARNYAVRQGEIDLIMRDGRVIVFVEVKTRRHEDFVSGEQSINYPKRKHLEAAARHYLAVNRLRDFPCRFDAVIVVLPEGEKAVIRHQGNAFRASRG